MKKIYRGTVGRFALVDVKKSQARNIVFCINERAELASMRETEIVCFVATREQSCYRSEKLTPGEMVVRFAVDLHHGRKGNLFSLCSRNKTNV